MFQPQGRKESLRPQKRPEPAPARSAVERLNFLYRNAAKTSPAPSPWRMPEMRTVVPYWEPMMSSPVAATASQNRAAPGLRMMSMPRTAGIIQPPAIKPVSGGYVAFMGMDTIAAPWDQAQKITPPAMAIKAATTMSTTRQL